MGSGERAYVLARVCAHARADGCRYRYGCFHLHVLKSQRRPQTARAQEGGSKAMPSSLVKPKPSSSKLTKEPEGTHPWKYGSVSLSCQYLFAPLNPTNLVRLCPVPERCSGVASLPASSNVKGVPLLSKSSKSPTVLFMPEAGQGQ